MPWLGCKAECSTIAMRDFPEGAATEAMPKKIRLQKRRCHLRAGWCKIRHANIVANATRKHLCWWDRLWTPCVLAAWNSLYGATARDMNPWNRNQSWPVKKAPAQWNYSHYSVAVNFSCQRPIKAKWHARYSGCRVQTTEGLSEYPLPLDLTPSLCLCP